MTEKNVLNTKIFPYVFKRCTCFTWNVTLERKGRNIHLLGHFPHGSATANTGPGRSKGPEGSFRTLMDAKAQVLGGVFHGFFRDIRRSGIGSAASETQIAIQLGSPIPPCRPSSYILDSDNISKFSSFKSKRRIWILKMHNWNTIPTVINNFRYAASRS